MKAFKVFAVVAFFGGLAAVAGWALYQQKIVDDGNELVLFNPSDETVEVSIDGETHDIEAHATWRDRVAGGEHVVDVGAGKLLTLKLGWDRAHILVPTEPVGLAVVDRAAEYANLSTGRMVGRGVKLKDVLRPKRYWRFERRALSPFEPMPESTRGAPPLQTFVTSKDAHEKPDETRRELEQRLGTSLTRR